MVVFDLPTAAQGLHQKCAQLSWRAQIITQTVRSNVLTVYRPTLTSKDLVSLHEEPQ